MKDFNVVEETAHNTSLFQRVRVTVQQWAEDTTFHCVKYVFDKNSNIVRRLFWLVLIGVMWYYTVSGCVSQIERFLSYKPLTRETVRFEQQLEFPSVTICGQCRVQNNSWTNMREKKVMDKALEWMISGTATYTVDNISIADVKLAKMMQTLSVSADKMFYTCTWQGVPFNCTEGMKPHYVMYTNCFTFNYKEEAGTFMATTTGTFSGLNLMLFLDQENCYFGGICNGAGVKFLVHGVAEEPDYNLATSLPPGFHHSIGVTKHEKKHLPLPVKAFGDTECLDTSGDFKNPLKYFDEYSVQACEQECYSNFVNRTCGCVLSLLSDDFPVCGFHLDVTCANPAYAKFWAHYHEYVKDCGCLIPCTDTTYSTKVSSLYIPDRNFKLPPKENVSRGLDYSDKDYIRENFLSVELYYDTKMVHVTEQLLEFTREDLFAAFGGFLGLAVGASILTMLEFLEMILVVLIRLGRSLATHDKHRNNIFTAFGGFLGLAVGASILTMLEFLEMILVVLIRLGRSLTTRAKLNTNNKSVLQINAVETQRVTIETVAPGPELK